MNKRGRPRTQLNELCAQWDCGNRRGATRNAARALAAFHRHLIALRPECLKTPLEIYNLALQVQRELPCLCREPFDDPLVVRPPPEEPTRETAGGPPDMHMHIDADDPDAVHVLDGGLSWRAERVAVDLIVAVEHDDVVLHFGEHLQFMIAMASHTHIQAWFLNNRRMGLMPEPDYMTEDHPQDGSERLMEAMAALAVAQAEGYVARHPEARILGTAPEAPGMYAGWPPAQPTGEPPMDDGSHLMASERGRRVIDPVTGMRMIRTMVMPDGEWPHWEWSEDVAGPGGVGPWGPGVSFGTPDEPAQMSPRESMRGHLTRIGRLDLLVKYAPWPGDPPL